MINLRAYNRSLLGLKSHPNHCIPLKNPKHVKTYLSLRCLASLPQHSPSHDSACKKDCEWLWVCFCQPIDFSPVSAMLEDSGTRHERITQGKGQSQQMCLGLMPFDECRNMHQYATIGNGWQTCVSTSARRKICMSIVLLSWFSLHMQREMDHRNGSYIYSMSGTLAQQMQ